MELKKDPKLDLRKKYGLFLNVGLVISMCLVITAFEWRAFAGDPVVTIPKGERSVDEILEIPITVLQAPQPKLVAPQVKAVDDEELPEEKIEITFDPEVTVEEPSEFINDFGPLPTEHVEDIHRIVEEMPEPEGGITAFYQYLAKNIKYPALARKMGVTGNVTVQFVIDKDGSITDIEILKGIGSGCDEEAIRVLQKAQKWKPGKQRGVPVKVRMVIPIFFRLN